MSNINQILNSALLESGSNYYTNTHNQSVRDNESASEAARKDARESNNEMDREQNRTGRKSTSPGDIETVESDIRDAAPWYQFKQPLAHTKNELVNNMMQNKGKYAAATLAALGAGIGAVALAKKLRAKKAAVKEAPKK